MIRGDGLTALDEVAISCGKGSIAKHYASIPRRVSQISREFSISDVFHMRWQIHGEHLEMN